jgi:hypothetical protein
MGLVLPLSAPVTIRTGGGVYSTRKQTRVKLTVATAILASLDVAFSSLRSLLRPANSMLILLNVQSRVAIACTSHLQVQRVPLTVTGQRVLCKVVTVYSRPLAPLGASACWEFRSKWPLQRQRLTESARTLRSATRANTSFRSPRFSRIR